MEKKEQNILERIHAAYYHLTASERKVSDYVLAHHEQVQFMSITQLADECNVAEATVSRFCRNLKLSGFNAFKIELAKHSAATAAQKAPPPSTDTPLTRFEQVARTTIDAIGQTLELTDPQAIGQAVELFEQAGRVICIGAGGSMIMASECAHMFSTVTGKFSAVSDSHSQMSATATMSRQDVIVLFSYSGATTSGLQVLELAKNLRIPTVLVTRFSKSPAAKLATVVLRCGSNEGPFQFGSVPAKVAQLIIIDILFQEYCSRNPEICQENIRKIATALSGKHL